jgi:NitT/TauT family transport system permease protein
VNARRGPWRSLEAVVLPLAGLAVAVFLWWLAVELASDSKPFLTRFAPRPTLDALVDIIRSGEVWPDVVASLRRVVVALIIATAVGAPLGVLSGSMRRFRAGSTPAFQFIRMISPLAWTPLAIIVFGVGDSPVYFLIAVGGVWPVMLNTAAGVQSLDRRWVLVARSLGASRVEIFRTVTWPAIRPHVLTGIRLAVGLAWVILVPAEMLGVDSGLGYAILDARDRLAYSEMMAIVLIIGFVGMLLDISARVLLSERRRGGPVLVWWRSRQRREAGLEAVKGAPVDTVGTDAQRVP